MSDFRRCFARTADDEIYTESTMIYITMKKALLGDAKHCVLAVVRRSPKFRTAADPLPGGDGAAKSSGESEGEPEGSVPLLPFEPPAIV